MRSLLSLLLLLALTHPVWARIATVRTFNGLEFTGHIRLVKDGVRVVNSEENLAVTVPGTNIFAVLFPEEARPLSFEEAVFGQVPAGWSEMEIGNVKTAGSTRVERQTFTVRGSGLTMDGENDSFHYVYKLIRGDYEIVARVSLIQYTDPIAKAGLMFRETMSDYSRYVMVAATAQRGGSFQARHFDGRLPQINEQPDVRPSSWLKLRRRGQDFAAFKSSNGRQWALVEQIQLPIAESCYVGLAVASAREGTLNYTVFYRVRDGVRVANQEFTPVIELTSGSWIVAQPSQADAERITFGAGRRFLSLPTPRVARVVFQPLTAELGWKSRASRPGVWVQSGDFFEGDFDQLAAGKLRVSSVLYGPRTFFVDDEVASLTLKRPATIRPAVEVIVANGETAGRRDGSIDSARLVGSAVSFEDGEVALKEPALGTVRIPAFAIRELRRNRP